MAQEGDIAAAYIAGRKAAEDNKPLDDNPYYHATEEWDAHRSGWLDRTNQLKKLRPDDCNDQPELGDDGIDLDPSDRI